MWLLAATDIDYILFENETETEGDQLFIFDNADD